MKKKVCFLTSSLFNLGGIQRCTTLIINKLIDLDYDVHLICTDNRFKVDYDLYKLDKKAKIKYIPIYKFEQYFFFWTVLIKKIAKKFKFIQKKKGLMSFCYYKKKFFYNKKIINYINKNNIDVTIGVGGYYSFWLGVFKEKISSKIIGWQHSSCYSYFIEKSSDYTYQLDLIKESISKLDNYIVLTEDDKKWIKKKFNYDAICIYNPKSFYSKEKSDLSSKNFIAVGRFASEKGFERLISSFKIFSKTNSDWKLMIIGEGPEKKILEDKIKNLKLEDRIFLYPKTNQIEKFYLNASIYLLSSYYEGLPMILIEACEFGLPIITYDLPCCIEQFNKCSLLIKNNNIEEYAKAMLNLVSDESLMQKLSKQSIINSKKYEIDKIIKKWEEIL